MSKSTRSNKANATVVATTWCKLWRNHFRTGVFVLLATICLNGISRADEDQQEANAKRAYSRYLQLLQRSPKEGVALDRVYGFHVDRGTLEEFLETLRSESAQGDETGASAMLLGLVESRRGRDRAAVAAFETAESKRPEDAMVSWYLGQSLMAVGQTEAAAEAMERALTKKVPRVLQEQVFLKLGRVYQRTQQTQKAIELWKRFENAYPNDDRVQEQIASILVDENQLEDALARYESLVKTADEPYQRIQYGVKAAELKLRIGRKQDGFADYENLLQDLKPSSWLYNDVRGRIEESYLRTDDFSGLVAYYEKWMQSHRDDVDAMTRLGKYLGMLGRSKDAQAWYRKAIGKAPSNDKIRLALIEQLIGDNDYAAAIKEYEELASIDPGNPDNIERWGMLYLRHPDLNAEQRREKAANIWKRLLAQKEDDAITASRLADLFRSASMEEAAIASYQRAIKLQPEDPQYREYLGEYFHILNRPDAARDVWQGMAVGNLRNTQNLVRLSEIYKSFGYSDEALSAMEAACDMDPEFGDRIRLNTMLRDARRFNDSLAQLDKVERLVASPEEQQIILQERIKTYSNSGQLAGKTDELERKTNAESTADEWRIVATYQEAMNRLPAACRSAAEAVAREPESISALALSARVLEASGALGKASAINKTLAKLDPRFRSEYIKKTAELERRLGRIDLALQAGRDLITAAPGNPESYRFYSNLCFDLGKTELGLDALRRSVRVNPSDIESLAQLAQALADEYKTPEAIELYWRAFQQADKLDNQIKLVQTLTELHLRTNSFDRLIFRLKNQTKDLSQQRDMVICLANAHQAAGDNGAARDVLTQLLAENSNDVILLEELVFLAEQANEFKEAIGYQQQIVKLTNQAESQNRLANLYLRSGDPASARKVWSQLNSANGSGAQVVKSIDQLILENELPKAKHLCEEMLAANSEDWEALLRLAVVSWKLGEKDDAVKICDQILAMKLPSESASSLKTAVRTPNAGTSVTGLTNLPQPVSVPSVVSRSARIYQMLTALRFPPQTATTTPAAGWDVIDFGDCRSAAVCIKVATAMQDDSLPKYLAELKQNALTSANDNVTSIYDLWSASITLSNISALSPTATSNDDLLATTVELLRQNASDESRLALLLAVLTQRNYQSASTSSPPQTRLPNAEQPNTLLETWDSLRASRPEWLKYVGTMKDVILKFRAAGEDDLAEQLIGRLTKEDATVDDLETALWFTIQPQSLDRMLELSRRLATMSSTTTTATGSAISNPGLLFAKFAERATKSDDEEALRQLVTTFLDIKALTFNPRASVKQTSTPVVVTGQSRGTTIQIFQGGNPGGYEQTITLPPNKYFDATDQTFFVNLCKHLPHGPGSDLQNIVESYNSNGTKTQKVFAELALASISLLNGNEEQSIVHRVRAAALAPDADALRLNLVQYYDEKGNTADALALLDTINTADQTTLKDREMLALQLASKIGNTDRARKAAETLFGLRLDSKTALSLSRQMKTLGLEEAATALQARTRRSAGNNLQTLVSLLNQYTKEGNLEIAAEVAHQILRTTKGISVSRTNGISPDSARRVAVSVLARTEQLDSLIKRTVGQLRRSPKSIPLHRSLLEYYVAAGKADKASDVRKKLESLTPETADTLLADAKTLISSRKYSEACDKFIEAFKKDSKRLNKFYLESSRVFYSAGRIGDLIDILNEDKTFLQSPDAYQIVATVVQLGFQQSLRQNPIQGNGLAKQKAIKLFGSAWDAFPNYRGELIGRIQTPTVWFNVEMQKYVLEGVIPTTIQQAIAKPWLGIADSVQYAADARATGTISVIAQALRGRPERTREYAAKVKRAVERFDTWHGGKVILAILAGMNDDKDEACEMLDQLRKDPDIVLIPTAVSLSIATELERFSTDKSGVVKGDRFTQMAAALLADSLSKNGPSPSTVLTTFSTSPRRRLALLYHRLGNTEDARIAIQKAVTQMDYSRFSPAPGYRQFMKLQCLDNAAADLLKMGCPLDALRYYRQINNASLAAAGRYGSSTRAKQIVTTARAGEKRAVQAITPASVSRFVRSVSNSKNTSLDLLIEPPEKDGKPVRISSIVIDRLLESDDATANEEIAQTLKTSLNSDAAADSTTAILAVQFAAKHQDNELLKLGMKSLQTYLESTEPVPVKKQNDLPLWLAAGTALGLDDFKDLGEQLADRATAAAEANSDRRWLIAIMKERGDLAILDGNKKLAEQSWSRWLDVILADNTTTTVGSKNDEASRSGKSAAPKATESALDELRKQLLQKASQQVP